MAAEEVALAQAMAATVDFMEPLALVVHTTAAQVLTVVQGAVVLLS